MMFSNTRRLRVLQVLPTFGVGGAENMAAHLICGLNADHDVTVVSLYPTRHSPIEDRLRQAGVRIVYLEKKLGLDLRILPRLSGLLRDVQPDIVHTHLYALRYVYAASLLQSHAVIIHTLHNTAGHETDGIGRVLQTLAFRHRVTPVAISREGADSFARVYGHRCTAIIPNSIPVREYQRSLETAQAWRERQGLPSGAIVFICIGRLEPQKNPLGLIAAFAAVEDARCHLLMLGAGALEADVRLAIEKRGLSGRVHLMGKRDDIPDCLAASDIFVLASNWEGNPLSVMEAMAAGLPVVGTAVGGVPELVDHGVDGLLVPAADATALAAAMRDLAKDREWKAQLGKAARERARRCFDASNMTNAYARLYRSLVAAQRHSRSRPHRRDPQPAGSEKS